MKQYAEFKGRMVADIILMDDEDGCADPEVRILFTTGEYIIIAETSQSGRIKVTTGSVTDDDCPYDVELKA